MDFFEGIGNTSYWSFFPASDLLGLFLSSLSSKKEEKLSQFNVLQLGTDVNSIIKTISTANRHKDNLHEQIQFNCYLVESKPEVLCRNLILLYTFFDSSLSHKEKADIYADIFANLKITKTSSNYIQKVAQRMRNLIANDVSSNELHEKMFDFAEMKLKHKDELEEILKQWKSHPESDINEYRDRRLRAYYKERYDVRRNLIDWDYFMVLKNLLKEPIVHEEEFQKWRLDGVTINPLEGGIDQCTEPNHTLVAMSLGKENGKNVMKRGYWGDILISPFITLGIECEDKSMFKKMNTEYEKFSSDIFKYNVETMSFEWTTGKKFLVNKKEKNHDRKEHQLNVTVKIFPILSEGVADLIKKKHFANKFDAILMGALCTHNINQQLDQLLRGPSVLGVESLHFFLSLKPEQKTKFATTVVEKLKKECLLNENSLQSEQQALLILSKK